jgi:hypothetical protein
MMWRMYSGVFCFFVLLAASGRVYADDFSYTPYPVLLVHGFNTTIARTWGINTKKQDKESNGLYTAFWTDPNTVFEPQGDANENQFGATLLPSFKADGSMATDPSAQDYSGILQRTALADVCHLQPCEEDSSYIGINHAFVEAYCPYYFNESDDRKGTALPFFWGGSLYPCDPTVALETNQNCPTGNPAPTNLRAIVE